MNIAICLDYLFPNSTRADWTVSNDGTGQKITMWNLPDPQPTNAELQSAWDAANAANGWGLVRGERQTLIEGSDWTQLGDVPLTPTQVGEWEVYRQALRDITTQPDPYNITWPTPPA